LSLRDMSVGKNAKRLYALGAAFAKRQVDSRHFPAAFDPPPAR